jgi:hypothetical protein
MHELAQKEARIQKFNVFIKAMCMGFADVVPASAAEQWLSFWVFRPSLLKH